MHAVLYFCLLFVVLVARTITAALACRLVNLRDLLTSTFSPSLTFGSEATAAGGEGTAWIDDAERLELRSLLRARLIDLPCNKNREGIIKHEAKHEKQSRKSSEKKRNIENE